MKPCFILAVLFLSVQACLAQVLDDFTDGDFSTNPVWAPNQPGSWVVENNQLRSNTATTITTFYISTPSSTALSSQWEFWINLKFNTSSQNYVDAYLMSAVADLSSAENQGYFVRIGGTPDEISLYKIASGVTTLLIDGIDGITNTSNTTLRIKVIRDENNVWTLARDVTGTGDNFFSEGTVIDHSILSGQFFGFLVRQSTESFFNKHFIDNIYVGPIKVESVSPTLSLIEVISAKELKLIFSEMISEETAEDVSNYSADHELGSPQKVSLEADGLSVTLSFPNDFANGIPHQLTVSGIQDLVGNTIISVSKDFLFYQPIPTNLKDIVFTEFFPDPSPSIGLPSQEFIELYNRTQNPIRLLNWQLADATSIVTLPSTIILPEQYLIVTATANTSLFSKYGNVLGISGFPALNNSGDILTLKNEEGQLIDSINYSLAWYRDQEKLEGGWTLELIDPNNLCGEQDNWAASEALEGGTPGKQNSIFANRPDLTGPTLQKAYPLGDNTLLLQFNEKLRTDALTAHFNISPEIAVSNVTFTNSTLRDILLSLSSVIQSRTVYTLSIADVHDCAGNLIQGNASELNFVMPEMATPLDMVINEVLFNPRPSAFDFVEVYNQSDKYINIKNWSLAHYENDTPVDISSITKNDLIIAPKSYLVFTENPASLRQQYSSAVEELVITTKLPSLPDDEGSIALLTDASQVIDFFLYHDDWHSPLIKDDEGVSLERISFTGDTNDAQNWRSANSYAGYATPGYLNSNARPDQIVSDGSIELDPLIFSPDSPLTNFTRINYKFDRSGFQSTVLVYNYQGHLIKSIANNESLAFEGSFQWNGDSDDGTRALPGYYTVWFEVFDLDGTVKTFRKRVVIASY